MNLTNNTHGIFYYRPVRFPAACDGFSTDIQMAYNFGYIGWVPNGILINDRMYEKGHGQAVRCMITGIYFPSSRIRQLSDGRMVGDVVVREPAFTNDEEPWIEEH